MFYAAYSDRGVHLTLTPGETKYILHGAAIQTRKLIVELKGKGIAIRHAKNTEGGAHLRALGDKGYTICQYKINVPPCGRTEVTPTRTLDHGLPLLVLDVLPEKDVAFRSKRKKSRDEPLYRPKENPPKPVVVIAHTEPEQSGPPKASEPVAPAPTPAPVSDEFSELKAAIELVNEEAKRVGATLRIEGGQVRAKVIREVDL